MWLAGGPWSAHRGDAMLRHGAVGAGVRLAAKLGVAAILLLAKRPPALYAHPLHTTLTEVTVDVGGLRLTIRGFADDFAAATVARRGAMPRPAASDSAIGRYVASAVVVVDQAGRRIPLGTSEIRRTGGLVWITLRAPAVKTLRGVKLACALFVELFDDQVNIVQEAATDVRHSLLFTSGDARTLKALLS